MSKLPVVKPRVVIGALKKQGFVIDHQTGSHVIMEKPGNPLIVTVPMHNKDLKKMCMEGKFRWDLYYRLSVVDLYVPSLAECGPGEVDELFGFFLDTKKEKLRKPGRLKPSREVLQAIRNYPFPGNIRELENLVEKLYVYCENSIELPDLPEYITAPSETISLKMEDVEKQHIRKVLKLKNNNQRQTAMAIGWAINTLRSKMERYGLGGVLGEV